MPGTVIVEMKSGEENVYEQVAEARLHPPVGFGDGGGRPGKHRLWLEDDGTVDGHSYELTAPFEKIDAIELRPEMSITTEAREFLKGNY